MHRIVVIANPSASQFTGGAHRDIMSLLGKRAEVEAIWPGTPSDAEARSARAAGAGAEIVIAMGGDGIVHHVAQGLIGTDAALGIIPAGTTNVVARLLGIPSKPLKAARVALEGSIQSVGTVEMTLSRGSVETTHHAVFACGIGLDASVVVEADKDPYKKYRFGSIHYATTALKVGLRDFPRRKPDVTITIGSEHELVTAAQVQFREIYTYFGAIPVRLDPHPPDPMTLLTLGRLHRRRVPRILLTLLRQGSLDSIPEMHTYLNVERFDFEAAETIAAQADGEPLGLVDGGAIRWSPDSLRVIAPQSP
ncbi:MAG: diacylglycerol kinase family protein [Acidimicrobiia bacterium]